MAQRTPFQAQWIRRGTIVKIHKREIKIGLFYFGRSLPCLSNPSVNENCLVDPTLPEEYPADSAGGLMPYWPAYATMAPASRSAYNGLLAGSLDDPNTYIGYVFLRLYGLEWRLMIDPTCDDAGNVLDEVRRLLSIFGSNASFRRYATALLDAYNSKVSIPNIAVGIGPIRDFFSARSGLQPETEQLSDYDLFGLADGARYRKSLRRTARREQRARFRGTPDLIYRAASGTFEIRRGATPMDGLPFTADIPNTSKVQSQNPRRAPPTVMASIADLALTTIIPARQGLDYPIPRPSRPLIGINPDQLQSVRSATRTIASILDPFFRDDETTGGEHNRPVTAALPRNGAFELRNSHRALLHDLLARDAWSRTEFSALAKRHDLMPGAVREAINQWTSARWDDVLLTGFDPILVDTATIPPNYDGDFE